MNQKIKTLFGKQFELYENRGVNLDEQIVFFIDQYRNQFFKIQVSELQTKIEQLMECYQFVSFDSVKNVFPVLQGSHKKYLRLLSESKN